MSAPGNAASKSVRMFSDSIICPFHWRTKKRLSTFGAKVVSIVFGPEKVLLAEEDPLLDELPLVGEWPLTLDLSKER